MLKLLALAGMLSVAVISPVGDEEAYASTADPTEPLVLTADNVLYSVSSDCGECAALACPTGEHKVHWVGISEFVSHGCQGPAWCTVAHPPCLNEEEDVQEFVTNDLIPLWESGATDLAMVRELLVRRPDVMWINAERHSLQISTCGVLRASLPLSREQLARLTQ